MDEQELISGIKRGDRNLFKEFILNYRSFVLNVCYKFVNNSDDANDVAQEVFIEVYKNIGKFRGDSSVSTWLYRIAVNKSLNFIRGKKKNAGLYESTDTPSEGTPDSELINKERAKILDDAINLLPQNQKAAFVLSKKEDLSNKQIGEILHLSVKAVESLLDRAKKNLQKRLIKYYR